MLFLKIFNIYPRGLDNEKSEHQHQLDLNTVLHQEHTIEDTKNKKQHSRQEF